jgi:hypothetical protein
MANNSAPTIEGVAEVNVRRLADAIEPAIRGTESAPSATRSVTEAFARILLAGNQPLRTAFLARALNAVAELTTQLEESDLGNATGASSDYQVLLYALEAPQALQILRRPDPLAAARLRGIEARARLLDAAGEPLTVDQVTKHLHISRQAVDKRRRAGKLIGLATGRRGYLYPSWQFGPDGLLSGLEDVLHHLDIHDPWMQVAFFVNGSTYLDGEAPLSELQRGHLTEVLRAAKAYGEQGAA